jgi:glycosyltransferase involved in cell wall biosynthesis
MANISVIIPFYNASKHIVQCIRSIQSQTYKDFEVLFIDDCSTDNSSTLLQETWEEQNNNILARFYKTEKNSGPGVARNIGLAQASGKYILFIDIDDSMDKEMLELLITEAETHNLDITECQAIKIEAGENDEEHELLSNPSFAGKNVSDKRRKKLLTTYTAYIWTLLFKKEFLNKYNIQFPTQRYSEDNAFIGCCLLTASRFGHLKKPLYYYRAEKDSLSNKINENKYNEKRKSFDYLLDFARKNGLYADYEKELEYCYLKKGYLRPLLDYLKENNSPQSEQILNMEDVLYELFPTIDKNPYLEKNLNVRFAFNLIHLAPGIVTSGTQILKDLKKLLSGNK